MSERGVFAVDRGVFEHPLLAGEPFTRVQAFMWLISEAAWKPHRRAVGSIVVELGRGQTAHSLRFLARAWQWSEPRVRRFLTRLKTDAMIDARTDAGVTVITLCNYERYQRVSLPSDAATLPPTDAEPTQERRRLEDRENKEIEDMSGSSASDLSASGAKPEVEEPAPAAPRPDDLPAKPMASKRRAYPEPFEKLWLAYPVDPNMSKTKAFDVWRRFDEADRAWALAGVPGFVVHCRRNPSYRPVHLERFLRDRRFEGFAPQGQPDGVAAPEVTAERESGQRALVRRWQASPQSWPGAMGPKPNEPGCKIPGQILAEFGISTHATAPRSGASH